MEYPEDRLDSEKKTNFLTKKLSEMLTTKANKIIKKMQEANSDSLGIGRHIIAHHHETWQKINWEEKYPNVSFKARVNVEISKHGIFN